MKILQVIDSLNIGGAEKMCVQLANLLDENGYEVGLLYFSDSSLTLLDQVNDKIRVYNIKIKQNRFNPFYFRKINQIISLYDIVHVHMRTTLKIIYLSSFFGMNHTSIVFHDHTGSLQQFESSSKGLLISLAMNSYEYVAVYRTLYERSISRFGLKEVGTSVISNFVTKPEASKVKVFDFDRENLEILFVGNFRLPKNQHFLIKLCESLKKNGCTKFRFHILGSIHDPAYYRAFIEDVYQYSFKDHFSIYTEVTSIFEFDGMVNFAVMPSKEESGPLVLIEYLILKLPFLAYNVGDVTNIISKYLPNCVLDNLDAEDWVKKINSINFKENIDMYDRIYDSEFSSNIALSRWEQVYNKIN